MFYSFQWRYAITKGQLAALGRCSEYLRAWYLAQGLHGTALKMYKYLSCYKHPLAVFWSKTRAWTKNLLTLSKTEPPQPFVPNAMLESLYYIHCTGIFNKENQSGRVRRDALKSTDFTT